MKWGILLTLLIAAMGVYSLWKRVDVQVKKLLVPANSLYIGYADLPEKTQGVQLTPFEVKGWDGATVQACIVKPTGAEGELTPRQLAMLDRLSGEKLKDLREIDYVMVSVDWDHGIRSALPLAEELAAAGLTCVLWEPRGSNSARQWCTHGLQESRDVPFIIDALEKTSKQKDLMIVGVGQEFGAGLMLQAAAEEPRLRMLVAINPAASLNKILKRAQVSTPMREIIGMRMNMLTGLEPFDIAAVKSASAISRETPVLVAYYPDGGNDWKRSSREDAVAIYTQLQSDAKKFIILRSKDDAPDATTREIVYSPEGGTREVIHRVEATLTNEVEDVPIEALRWMNSQVSPLQEQPVSSLTPNPDK